MTSQAGVKKSLDAARTSDVVEKVFAHRSSKKASAFSCPTRDRIDAVDHFISPKVGPKSLLWDFFNNVTSACATAGSGRPLHARGGNHAAHPRRSLAFGGASLYVHPQRACAETKSIP